LLHRAITSLPGLPRYFQAPLSLGDERFGLRAHLARYTPAYFGYSSIPFTVSPLGEGSSELLSSQGASAYTALSTPNPFKTSPIGPTRQKPEFGLWVIMVLCRPFGRVSAYSRAFTPLLSHAYALDLIWHRLGPPRVGALARTRLMSGTLLALSRCSCVTP